MPPRNSIYEEYSVSKGHRGGRGGGARINRSRNWDGGPPEGFRAKGLRLHVRECSFDTTVNRCGTTWWLVRLTQFIRIPGMRK